MNALIDTISEKLIILSLLNVHFLVSISAIGALVIRIYGPCCYINDIS